MEQRGRGVDQLFHMGRAVAGDGSIERREPPEDFAACEIATGAGSDHGLAKRNENEYQYH